MAKSGVSGFALILAIFVMLVFGILGWTLAVMQSGNLESSLRSLQEKQALYLAEAGAQWGLSNRMTTGQTTSIDTDCLDTADWVTHTLPPGQYKVCTRAPVSSEAADVVIESIGYVPGVANYTSSRQIKIMAYLGSFDKAVKTSGVFNWNVTNPYDPWSSYVAGDMLCAFYEANHNGVFNEAGIDYSSAGQNSMPRTNRQSRGARRDIGSGELPAIDMTVYENDANATILAPGNTTILTEITAAGSNTEVSVATPNFFSSRWAGQALRNISRGTWRSGSWTDILSVSSGVTALLNGTVNWTVNDRVTLEPAIGPAPTYASSSRRYTVVVNCTVGWPVGQAVRNFSRGTWESTDWGVINSRAAGAQNTTIVVQMADLPNNPPLASQQWKSGDLIGMVRMFTSDDADHGGLLNNRQRNGPRVLYIESDALFNVRSDSIEVSNVGVVVEGDSVIRGQDDISFSKWPLIYPNLATKNGNVYSPDHPRSHEAGRNFDDVIYSQNGDILFNYLDVKAVYGHNVTLSGDVRIRYDPDLEKLGGYSFGTSGVQWNEQ